MFCLFSGLPFDRANWFSVDSSARTMLYARQISPFITLIDFPSATVANPTSTLAPSADPCKKNTTIDFRKKSI
jgi:hypothetical protein